MLLSSSVDLVPALDYRTPLVGVAGADRPLVRRITNRLHRDGIEVADQATTLRELVLALSEMQVAVCAVDDVSQLRSPARLLRTRRAGAQLVAVVRNLQGPKVKTAVDLGVAGVVGERNIDVALSATVFAVVSGQIAVPRDSRPQLAYPLTQRERQIIELIQSGLTNRQIAGRLHLAESTVKSHVSAAFAKVGVQSRKEAQALRLKDLDPRDPIGD